MIHQLLAESTGHFWQPEEFKNVENPYFENLKHLQNPGHLCLTEANMSRIFILWIHLAHNLHKLNLEFHVHNIVIRE